MSTDCLPTRNDPCPFDGCKATGGSLWMSEHIKRTHWRCTCGYCGVAPSVHLGVRDAPGHQIERYGGHTMRPTEQMIEAGARALGESKVAISFDGLPAAIQRVARDEAHTVLSAALAAVPEPVRVRVRVDPNRYGMYDLINGQGERMDAAGLMLALIPISPTEGTP